MKSLPRDCVRLTHQNKRSFSSSVMRACLCTYVFPRTFVCVCLLTLDWNGTPSSWHHNLIPSHSWVNSSPLSSGDRLTAAGHSEECLYSFERAIFFACFSKQICSSEHSGFKHLPPPLHHQMGTGLFLKGGRKKCITTSPVKSHVECTTFPKCVHVCMRERARQRACFMMELSAVWLQGWHWRENQ